MRYILMPMGSAGDVHPFVGLALELRRRGHSVTLLTNGYFSELADRFDLEMIELCSREMFDKGITSPDLWHPFKGFAHLYQNLIYPTIQRQFDVIKEFASKEPVTVLINCFGFGALIAQEKLGVPVVSVHLQPVMLWSRHAPPKFAGLRGPIWLQNILFSILHRFVVDPIVLPTLNQIRREHNLAPISGIMHWWHSKTLVLCLFPEWYSAPQKDWPKRLTQTDFPLWDESEASEHAMTPMLAPEIERFLASGTPPIAFTPGSANIFGAKFFETAVEACKLIGHRAILLTRFPEQIPRNLPISVLHVPYVPLSHLLPRCAAFVHHGGIGSASQAMNAGIPQLIWPLAHDQFDNAHRIIELGIGDSLLPKHFTTSRLAKKLRAMLESEAMSQKCKSIATLLRPHDGIQRAVDRVEALALECGDSAPL